MFKLRALQKFKQLMNTPLRAPTLKFGSHIFCCSQRRFQFSNPNFPGFGGARLSGAASGTGAPRPLLSAPWNVGRSSGSAVAAFPSVLRGWSRPCLFWHSKRCVLRLILEKFMLQFQSLTGRVTCISRLQLGLLEPIYLSPFLVTWSSTWVFPWVFCHSLPPLMYILS